LADKKETKQPNAIQRFVRETIGELRKVNWPTWLEARKLTLIVIAVLIVMSMFLGAVDYGAAWLLNKMVGL
jgi:preprotein translocase subunit SecE